MESLLKMSGISKSFPGVRALIDVDFDLKKGELHALVGENGAGKSTLMKVLSGLYKADEGTLELKGEELKTTGLREMIELGIGIIYQELNLIPYLSVAENIFLGREPRTKLGTIDWPKLYKMTQAVLAPFQLNIKPRQKVASLGAAYQQIVEIAKALSLNAEILVMDEPTAALAGFEVERLFEIIGRLKKEGVSIVYISHRLDEVHLLADRITILRDGEKVVTKARGEMTNDEMIRHMVGRVLEEQYPQYDSVRGEAVLEVKGLTKAGVCEDISFTAYAGEILGFVGLVGAGRTEILQTLYGYFKKDQGEILLHGKPIKIRNCRDAVTQGIGLLPEERKQQGLVLGMNVFDNAALTVLDLYSKFGVLQKRKIAHEVNTMVDSMNIRTPSIRQLVMNLSGGNQQKVVLAKWFIRHCDVYIFDEPTRGIDVGAKVEIYRLMQNLAKRGAAVIMISSELPEVMNISDQVAVIFEGKLVKKFKKGELNDEEVMQYSLGLHERREA